MEEIIIEEQGGDEISQDEEIAENESALQNDEPRVNDEELCYFANKELKELSAKYDGAPSSLEEMWQNPQRDKMMDLWSKGLSVEEAYCALNASEIIERERKRTKQATMAQLNGKNHLAPVGGASDVTAVPQEVMNIYKKMLPKMTETQIREEYKKYMSDL
ncbi:MAG: hypothetical protein RR424_02895 [Oscillospiraceae bacterium]